MEDYFLIRPVSSCNPCTWEVEGRGSQVLGRFALHWAFKPVCSPASRREKEVATEIEMRVTEEK